MIAFVLAAVLAAVAALNGSPPGLFAPPEAANVIGVQGLDPLSTVAAGEMMRQLAASPALRPIAIEEDPAASDCSRKAYSTAVRIVSTQYATAGGWYLDLGLSLVDCAGWRVDEWHESLALSRLPNAADAQRLGINLLLRFRTWSRLEPARARELFERGLAYDPADARPTYLYTLFKTDDGYMRAMVRPGGPAYVAGMRSNDIVDKLDGRFWWEYGTYQTQQRAYDGRPHTFELTRGKEAVRVALGLPFDP